MSAKYNVDHWVQVNAYDEQLEKWAADPLCIEKDECAAVLAERVAKLESDKAVIAAKKDTLQANPFDPRTEVSADAKHIAGRIVKHLWILFVLLPFIVGLLLALIGVIK